MKPFANGRIPCGHGFALERLKKSERLVEFQVLGFECEVDERI